MKMQRVFLLGAVVLCSLILVGATFAQVTGSYDLSWWTVDSGGAVLIGTPYALAGTVGQPEPGPVLSGGDYSLVSGFWPGAGVTTAAGGKIYLPLVLQLS